jgi:hypothetical protein
VEGVGQDENDGAENYGNERNFHLRFANVGQMREYLHGYASWHILS